jgi:putative effector of murein hydrolase LrgA (UPF0299 family)
MGSSPTQNMEIIIIAVSIFLGFCLGFFVAGLMVEAKKNEEAEKNKGHHNTKRNEHE